MLRPAAAAIAVFGAVITLSPGATAWALDTTATTTTGVTTTSTTAGGSPTTTATTTTTTPPKTRKRTPDAPVARARAAQEAVVTVSANCAYFCFVPANTTIPAGGTVTWVDKSSTAHNVTRCTPANCNGASGGTGTDAKFTAAHLAIPADGTARFTFAEPGTYVYYCAIHGYGLMHGTITVTAAAATSTTVPATAAPVAVDPGTTVAGPQLANTGSGTSGALAVSFILLGAGLAATSFQLRRRHSSRPNFRIASAHARDRRRPRRTARRS